MPYGFGGGGFGGGGGGGGFGFGGGGFGFGGGGLGELRSKAARSVGADVSFVGDAVSGALSGGSGGGGGRVRLSSVDEYLVTTFLKYLVIYPLQFILGSIVGLAKLFFQACILPHPFIVSAIVVGIAAVLLIRWRRKVWVRKIVAFLRGKYSHRNPIEGYHYRGRGKTEDPPPREADDRSLVLAAVTEGCWSLMFASPRLQGDKAVVMAAIHGHNRSGMYSILGQEVWLKDLHRRPFKTVLKWADARLQADKELVLAAVTRDGGSLEFAAAELKKDKEVVLAAVTHGYSGMGRYGLRFASAELKKDKEVALAAVRAHPMGAFRWLDESMAKDREVVVAALRRDGETIRLLDESLKKDKELVLLAVTEGHTLNGKELSYVDESLRNDKDVVMAAVTTCGLMLKHASKALRCDKEVVLAAVKQDWEAIYAADRRFRKDKEVVLAAVTLDAKKKRDNNKPSSAVLWADNSLLEDKELLLAVVSIDPTALAAVREAAGKKKLSRDAMRMLSEDADLLRAARGEGGAPESTCTRAKHDL